MTNSDEFRAIKCPNCGAPMTFSGDQEICNYCGVTIERIEDDDPERPERPEQPRVRVARIDVNQVSVSQAAAGRQGKPRRIRPIYRLINLLLNLVKLIFIVFIIGLLVFMFRTGQLQGLMQKVQFSAGSYGIYGQAIPLLDEEVVAEPDFLTLLVNWSSDEKWLTYVNGDSRSVRWRSPAWRDSGAYQFHTAVGPTAIYLAQQASLQALDRASGDLLWQATLSDEITSLCPACLVHLADHVIVLTKDGRLQSFDAQSGRPAWEVRLVDTPRYLYLVEDQVAVLDRVSSEDNRVVLKFFEPAGGQMSGEIVPACLDQYSGQAGFLHSLYVPLMVDPDEKALYIFDDSIDGCAQRWDITTRQLVWRTAVDDDWGRVDWDADQPPLLAGRKLYFGTDDKNGGRVIGLNSQDGGLSQLGPYPDYELIPLAEQNELLVLLAIRTRGSKREALWGVETGSGTVRWQYLPQAETRYGEGGSSGGVWDWHLTPQGLIVLQVLPDPDRLVLETLNLQTGQPVSQHTRSLSASFLTAITWTDQLVWLNLRGLQALDLANGELVYTWP